MSLKRVNLLLVALALGFWCAWLCEHYDLNLRRLRYWSSGTVTIDGLTLHLNPDDRVITSALVNWGTWEPAETAVLRRELRPGDTFLDVGANVGYYTLIASKLVGPTGRVIAFEPDPTSFALLKRSVEANGLSNVTLVQKALSDEPGTIKLFLDETNKGAHKIFQYGESRRFVEVAAVRLDDYLEGHEGRIDLIKIDTEGAEGAILKGMGKTLRRHENTKLLMEFFPKLLDGFGYDAAEVLAGLQSLGFEIRDIDEHKGWTIPISAEELLARHTTEKLSYTNLLLARPGVSRP